MKRHGIKKLTTNHLKEALAILQEEDFDYNSTVKYLNELQTRGEVVYVQGYISRNTMRWQTWNRRHFKGQDT